ncbi:hypothetical protein SUGI_0344890 [Cryptomeria japonica]|nr:hypothetical protein SUGI_0344890 [Cryptomeria japonica]
MGLFSNKISREDLKPGDHIYSWRCAYVYAHHGIYIGDNQVIHFIRGRDEEVAGDAMLNILLLSSGSSQNNLSMVSNQPCLLQKLEEELAHLQRQTLQRQSGVGPSGQAASVIGVFTAVFSSPLRFLITSTAALSTIAGGFYCLSRYATDIGIRRDVARVPVESLMVRVSLSDPQTIASIAAGPQTH